MLDLSTITGPITVGETMLVGLPTTAALGAIALIGYLFGQRTRRSVDAAIDERRRMELERAAGIAHKLESIAHELRQSLATHHSRVDSFKRRLQAASATANDQTWAQLCAEAESILGPTMEFAQRLSSAYDQIRQQTGALETFAHGRTDPLTGAGTARALDQHLQVMLDARAKGSAGFVIALVGLDRNKASATSMTRSSTLPKLPKLAAIIRSCMRESDFVARLGDEEFVVVMPGTTLPGARIFGERLLKRVDAEMGTTVACGLAEARADDDFKSLLARADSAFYSAKAAGINRIFVHNGSQIREHLTAARHSRENGSTGPAEARPTEGESSVEVEQEQEIESGAIATSIP